MHDAGEFRIVEATGHRHRVRQIGGADKHAVHPVDGQDLVEGRGRPDILGLHDDKRIVVRIGDILIERLEPVAGGADDPREAAVAPGAILHGPHGPVGLSGAVHLRHQNAAGADIHSPQYISRVVFRHPDHRRQAAHLSGADHRLHLGDIVGAVFGIDNRIIETGIAEYFHARRRVRQHHHAVDGAA